jgi:hypothetical protein
MHLFTSQRASRLLLILCVLGGVSLCWVQQPPPMADAAVIGAPFVVGGPEVAKVSRVDPTPAADLLLEPKLVDGRVLENRVRLLGNVALDVGFQDGRVVKRTVVVYSPFVLFGFMSVFALVAVLLPYALADGASPKPWYQLLSEQDGGYSLARVQLLLWSVPVIVIYGAVSAVSRSFMSIDSQLQILLGLSGVTTFLSTAASPAPVERGTSSSAALSDLVTDWNGQGDVSRYQYLLLSLFGSIVLVVSFLQKLELPHIPTELLYLVGGSQATYVVTKAVKQAQGTMPAKGGEPPPPVVIGAPGGLVKLSAAPVGQVIRAPSEVATTDGSICLPT